MHGAISTSAGPLKGTLASLSQPQGRPPSRRWRFVAALRCAPLARCSLSGAVELNASPVGSHEAHNALVEKNR